MRLVLADLIARPLATGQFWNVNLPSLAPHEPEPRIVHCPLEAGPLPLSFHDAGEHFHYNGNYHERPRTEGSDVAVCFGGHIAVTKLSV